MSVAAHVAVLSSGLLDQHCSACAEPAPASGLKRCPKCKTVWYCNSVSTRLRGLVNRMTQIPNRNVRTEIGFGTSENAAPCKSGRWARPRPTLPCPGKQSGV